MRAGSRGVLSNSAFVIVAVTPIAQITPAGLGERLRTIGYAVLEQPWISRTRSDGAVVLHGYAPELISKSPKPLAARQLAVTALAVGLAVAHVQNAKLRQQALSTSPRTVTWPALQPVWNIERWCCTGLELFVVDDGDACRQLDVLAQGIGCPRRRITIKPRVGWQAYGHPDVFALV